MTTARYGFPPRLFTDDAAAYYLGVSVSKLRGLGLPRVLFGGNRLYDLRTLDEYAASLPTDSPGENSCDEVWGTA